MEEVSTDTAVQLCLVMYCNTAVKIKLEKDALHRASVAHTWKLETGSTLIKPNYASVRQSRDSVHRATHNMTKKVAVAPCSETA